MTRDGRNMTLNAAGESLWGLLSGMIASSTVLVVLLRRYGASSVMIGAITAVEIGSTLMPQILGNYLFASKATRQRRLILWHLVAILPFLLVISAISLNASRLPAAAVRWSILGAYACYMLGIGVALAAWFDWISSVFPQVVRGRAMGLAFGASAILNFSGGLLAGRLLTFQDRLPVFSMLYLFAAVAGSASILTFGRLDDPGRGTGERTPAPRLKELFGRFAHSLSSVNFRRFLVGRIMATAGFCIVPFLAVYYTAAEGGGLDAAQVVSFGAGMPAGAALASLAFGWIGDRRGHRFGMVAGAAMQVVVVILLLSTSGPLSAAAVYFTVGLCNGAGAVSHFNMIFETCPHDHRLSHITIASLVLSLGVIFPLLAGFVVQELGLRTVLRAALVLSGGAFLWYLTMVREPRHMAIGAGSRS